MSVFFGLLMIVTGIALNLIRVRSGLPVGFFGNWFPGALQLVGFFLVALRVASVYHKVHKHE